MPGPAVKKLKAEIKRFQAIERYCTDGANNLGYQEEPISRQIFDIILEIRVVLERLTERLQVEEQLEIEEVLEEERRLAEELRNTQKEAAKERERREKFEFQYFPSCSSQYISSDDSS